MANIHELEVTSIDGVWKVVVQGSGDSDIRVPQGEKIRWRIDENASGSELKFQFKSNYRDYLTPVSDEDTKIAEQQVPLPSGETFAVEVDNLGLGKGETQEVPYAVLVVDEDDFVEGGSMPVIIIIDQ